MKNRFNRTLSILCAVMLLISAFSVWAAAEELATDTNLSPVEEEVTPETPAEGTEQESEQEPAENPEEGSAGDANDGSAVSITRTLAVGHGWEGTVSKEKPTVLKLNVAKAGHIYVLIEGKDVWVTKVKADNIAEAPFCFQTDSETEQLLFHWEAEEGSSYLFTLGPVEPNKEAKAKVTVMDKKAYEAWVEKQATITSETEEKQDVDTIDETVTETSKETQPETADEPEAEAGEEPKAEPAKDPETQDGEEPETVTEEGPEAAEGEEAETVAGEGTEPEIVEEPKPETEEAATEEENKDESSKDNTAGITATDESGDNKDVTDNRETTEQKTDDTEADEESENKESADIPDDETMLSMGFIKVQILKENGADIYKDDEMITVSDHLAFGTELWIKPVDGKNSAILSTDLDEANVQYINTDDVLIVLQKEETGEQAAQEDETVEQEDNVEDEQQIRSLKLSSSLNRINGFVVYGTPITLEAELVNFKEDDEYSCQWQFSADGEIFTDIENANELTYTYPISKENFNYIWKLIVMLKETE